MVMTPYKYKGLQLKKVYRNTISDSYQSIDQIKEILSIFSPNRIKILLLLDYTAKDAMRFKFIKRHTGIDPKNLQLTLNFLVEKRIVRITTTGYMKGETYHETHNHYYLSQLGRFLRIQLLTLLELMQMSQEEEFQLKNKKGMPFYEVLGYYYSHHELAVGAKAFEGFEKELDEEMKEQEKLLETIVKE